MNIKTLFSFLLSLTIVFSYGQNDLNKDKVQATEHSHQGHDHSGHNHAHDHAGHDHAGHDHAGHDHSGHDHGNHDGDHHVNNFAKDCGSPAKPVHHGAYDATATALHHISDANVYTILDLVRIPLPAIIYNKGKGFDFFMTSKFDAQHHDNGHYGYKDYVLYHGEIHKLKCDGFQGKDKFEVQGFDVKTIETADGKSKDNKYAIINGKGYLLEQKTIWDFGLLGGGSTSFYDLSPTKNVISMLLVCSLIFFVFRKVAKAYTTRDGQAPSGLQNFFEPFVQFVRDDVAIPFLGDKHARFLPLLLTLFFFVLGLNLWGQVPFLGGTNVTGSLTVTLVLAVIVFIVTNLNGKKDYWKHIFNMPGVHWSVKLILTPVEIAGLFLKPITLMLRLAANISAGHIAILSFIGLIFILGKTGTMDETLGGGLMGTALAIPLTMFMMVIELIVAFVQAYVFALLTASYIGDAVAEHDDHH